MSISQERLKELQNIFINNLQKEFEEALSYFKSEFEKDPEMFLKFYYSDLRNDVMEDRGLETNRGFYCSYYPLRLKDFTKEEVKYFGEVKNEI